MTDENTEDLSIEEQGEAIKTFLGELLDAFGLEGDVNVETDDETLIVDVAGDQTAALVGAKGSVLSAIHELSRTVIQRRSRRAARLRLDIAGYRARRQEALAIYAKELAEQVLADSGEIMLESMNAADRKVIHDAVSEIDGVRSFSEGEDPRRYVVIAAE